MAYEYTRPPVYPRPRFAIGDRVRISEGCEYFGDWQRETMVVIGLQAARQGPYGFREPEITYFISDPLCDNGTWTPTDGGSDGWAESDLDFALSVTMVPGRLLEWDDISSAIKGLWRCETPQGVYQIAARTTNLFEYTHTVNQRTAFKGTCATLEIAQRLCQERHDAYRATHEKLMKILVFDPTEYPSMEAEVIKVCAEISDSLPDGVAGVDAVSMLEYCDRIAKAGLRDL